jgi:hypothetical protein
MCSTSSRSAAWSIAVTMSVALDFVAVTSRTPGGRRSRSSSAAARAAASAISSSSVVSSVGMAAVSLTIP